MSELNISELLNETYTTTPIQVDKKTADGAVATVNSKDSLKIFDFQFNELRSLFPVQFDSKRSFVTESAARTSHHRCADVSDL